MSEESEVTQRRVGYAWSVRVLRKAAAKKEGDQPLEVELQASGNAESEAENLNQLKASLLRLREMA